MSHAEHNIVTYPVVKTALRPIMSAAQKLQRSDSVDTGNETNHHDLRRRAITVPSRQRADFPADRR